MATTESLVAQIQGLSSNAMDLVIAVSKRFKYQVLMLEVPMRGVAPLLEAVKKLRSSSEHLTALHLDFLQLCLLAKCYKTGLSILEDDIFEVDQPRDFFLYCPLRFIDAMELLPMKGAPSWQVVQDVCRLYKFYKAQLFFAASFLRLSFYKAHLFFAASFLRCASFGAHSGISCIEYPIGNLVEHSVLFWDLAPFEFHVCAGYNLEG
ncbi:hypothetical protein POTOM_054912 [Populus tomentosa]|uniref:COP9 signalosome complex subunit 3 N-terminal helical repeats domain-containing protein n=1 Tax=Populus tomentosa TaxID=118781 RepID=A0A8X8C584_POPTO|nr:hypothetical protein POTOM_054912 [Populus tomentosa]